MAAFTINQYQYRNFTYLDSTLGLYMVNEPDNIGFTYNGVDYTLEVDVVPVAGVYVFTINNSLNVFHDTITLTVTAVAPSVTHTLCLTDTLPLQAVPVGYVLSGNYYPEWLTLAFGYFIFSVNQVGTFYVLFEDSGNPNNVYLVEFVFDTCLDTYDFCTPWDINVTWLNPMGGWSSYCFQGKKTYQVGIENKQIYKNTNNIQRYSSVTGVYDKVLVLSGEIPISHLNFIKSLKFSIQAFVLGNTFLPILIEENDFNLYEDGDGVARYNIQVKYSTELLVQTQ
jgi:hypothetical protein